MYYLFRKEKDYHKIYFRYHAVLQFKNKGSPEKPIGFYMYDLDSTHGKCVYANVISRILLKNAYFWGWWWAGKIAESIILTVEPHRG